jgi:hypothetical protein
MTQAAKKKYAPNLRWSCVVFLNRRNPVQRFALKKNIFEAISGRQGKMVLCGFDFLHAGIGKAITLRDRYKKNKTH